MPNIKQNKMREIRIEKVVLNCGATGEKLERSVKLLEMLTQRKVQQVKSSKRIPAFGVRPGLKTGCMVTIRDKKKEEILKRLLGGINNKLKEKQIRENNLSFGIKEYLEIPGMDYLRDVGMLGLEASVVFRRTGKRVSLKKIKRGKIPHRQNVSKEEIMEFMKNKYSVEIE